MRQEGLKRPPSSLLIAIGAGNSDEHRDMSCVSVSVSRHCLLARASASCSCLSLDLPPQYAHNETKMKPKDVHAGNLLVLEDGRVGFIDFGIVGRIPQTVWSSLRDLR